jgi:hypothetical protein
MTEYDLHSLTLPKLTGVALRAFAAALDSPFLRSALTNLLKQGEHDGSDR